MGDQAYKQRHKAQGLCRECGRKAIPGESRCGLHNTNHRRQCKTWRENNVEKYREYGRQMLISRQREGRCKHCGKPLDPEVDEGFKNCVNCRLQLYRLRGVNPMGVNNDIIGKEGSI